MQNINESLKAIKHEFMAYRNGIISDTLRKAGMPYNIIFGLQLPQLSSIARSYPKDSELAYTLWQDKAVRESRLLAPYLFPPEEVSEEKAFALASEVQTREEADILCFRLLKYLPFADTLALLLSSEEEALPSYCGESLRRNLDAMK